MARPTIVLDCDPGHDDAVALVVAAARADLLGITTVAGNVPLERTTANALGLVALLGLDVPVHAGAALPLAADTGAPVHAELVHGESGLAGVTLPDHDREVASDDAVGFLARAAAEHDDLHLVATGPLTNVARLVRDHPEAARRLASIHLMGGGRFGNVTATAEFNAWFDPEAADVVLRSGVPITLCGLDLTHQLLVDDALLARLRRLPGDVGDFYADLLGTYRDNVWRLSGHDLAAIHDACAVLALTDPGLVTFDHRHVAVELRGEHTRGMTVIDDRPWMDGGPCRVVRNIDAPIAQDLIVDAVAEVGASRS